MASAAHRSSSNLHLTDIQKSVYLMSLNEDPSSSGVHITARPAVPEHLGKRFALVNAASRYEYQAAHALTDTVDTYAGSEVSFQVRPYVPQARRDSSSQSLHSSAHKELSLGEYLFQHASNKSNDAGLDWKSNFLQLEPVTDAQVAFCTATGDLLPIVPYRLSGKDVTRFCDRLSLAKGGAACHDRRATRTKAKHFVRASQIIAAHKGPIWTSAFSVDMSFFATAGQDGLVKVWKCMFLPAEASSSSPHLSREAARLTQSQRHTPLCQPAPAERLASIQEDGNDLYPANLTHSSLCLEKPRTSSAGSSEAPISSKECMSSNSIELNGAHVSKAAPKGCDPESASAKETAENLDEESTSSLTEEDCLAYELLESGLNKILPDKTESGAKLRPMKQQLSQLSQTKSLSQSTFCYNEFLTAKIPLSTPNVAKKQTPDALHIKTPSENVLAPFFLPAIRAFRGHTADIVSCSWSKSNFLATASLDKTVKIWSPIRGTCLDVLSHSAPVTCVLFHPINEKILYTATSTGEIHQWNVIKQSKISWAVSGIVTCMDFTRNKFSPPSGVIIVGTSHGKVYILTADTLRPIFEFFITPAASSKHGTTSPKILALSVIPDTNELLVSAADSQIRRYCLLSMLQIRQYKAHHMTGMLSAATPKLATLGRRTDNDTDNRSDGQAAKRAVSGGSGGLSGYNKECDDKFILIGDEKGSVCIYLESPPKAHKNKLSLCLAKRENRVISKKVQAKQKISIIRSCFKISLPQRIACTTISTVCNCSFTSELQEVINRRIIVVSTANGEIICIDV